MPRPTATTALASVVTLLGLPSLRAQTSYALGTRDVSWTNSTGLGSTSLAARVLYPATTTATNAPLLPRASGWPTIIFLHGFAVVGNSYVPLATLWAQQGFVVVLSNTMQFDNQGQEYDGRALFGAAQLANNTVGSPFQGGLDLQRVALAGHSMGGGNVANVLANNPGYRSGFAIAPVPPRGSNGAMVTVPIGVVGGNGDTIAPPASNALPCYQSLTAFTELKFFCLLNNDATHTNLAGLFITGTASTAVFQRSASIGLGLLQHTLGVSAQALEQAIGPPVVNDPRLVSLSQSFANTQVWTNASLQLGTTVRASVGLEPGIGGIGAAFAPLVAPLPTPLGLLRLDPVTAFVLQAAVVGPERRADVTIVVPNDPTLVGAVVSLQALGPTTTQPLSLGGAIALAVTP
ncbi:MAG: hypothetical protein ABIP94_17350 [Planctomycetota bacterium]